MEYLYTEHFYENIVYCFNVQKTRLSRKCIFPFNASQPEKPIWLALLTVVTDSSSFVMFKSVSFLVQH